MAVFAKKFYPLWLLLITLVLVGCGGDSAPAPTSAATAANNNVPTTPATVASAQPTGLAIPTATVGPTPTPNAATSQAQEDNITRVPVLPTTMPADPNLSKAVLNSLPPIKGTKEINTNLAAVNAQIANLQPAAVIKVYFSDDLPPTVINNAEVMLAGAGYRPGGNRAQPGKTGLYAKPGNPDISINASAIDQNTVGKSSLPGLSQTENQQLSAQLKGHKSLLLLIVAPNMAH